jgi:hypothetical protein
MKLKTTILKHFTSKLFKSTAKMKLKAANVLRFSANMFLFCLERTVRRNVEILLKPFAINLFIADRCFKITRRGGLKE